MLVNSGTKKPASTKAGSFTLAVFLMRPQADIKSALITLKRLVDDELNVNIASLQVIDHFLDSGIVMDFNNLIISIIVFSTGIISQ